MGKTPDTIKYGPYTIRKCFEAIGKERKAYWVVSEGDQTLARFRSLDKAREFCVNEGQQTLFELDPQTRLF
ncbi:hypothetical protein C6499_19110 [Candidatus Poribacteria bacterium]|nr:MAG: hypothetical protein C6499_19110 [Candidatus Poribacteria bacterium]